MLALLLAASLGVPQAASVPPLDTVPPLDNVPLDQGGATMPGTVVSATGDPLADATVHAMCDGVLLDRRTTDASGAFALEIGDTRACRGDARDGNTGDGDARVIEITVSADGFATVSRAVAVGPGEAGLAPVPFTLLPAGPAETVTVTAARRPLRDRDGPASVSVLSDQDLMGTAALTLDEALRLTPGFTLFRRSSSRSANPTTQGVTLRGQSASGASRSLVLADGVPLNDPFGGWVYWNRVPRAAIDRVEVARGGASDLYGADAVGGAVQVFMVDPVGRAGRLLVDAGSQGTARASGYAGAPLGGWRVLGAAELFETDGFIPVSHADRGPVDERAGVSTRALTLSLASPVRRGVTATTRAAFFDEDRTNGTPLQRNDTNDRQLAVDVTGRVRGDATWRVRGYALARDYDQTFSAVASDRQSEQLIQRQRVPTEVVAMSAEVGRSSVGISWLTGIDTRDTRGVLTQTQLAAPGTPTTSDGGRHRTLGAFGQASGAISSRLQLIAGVRADLLRTRLDHHAELVDDSVVSPRASLLWHVHPRVTVRGSAYRAFRSPTLNERLRGFRVGDVMTLPNATLAPEASTGGEAAAILSGAWGSLAVTAFHTILDDAITNVTVRQEPTLIVRERRNAGRIRASGVEIESAWHLRPFSARVSGTFTDATFVRSLEGLTSRRVSQVPRAQAAVDLRYGQPHIVSVAGQIRVAGSQWEDDRNTLRLGTATIVDLRIERDLVPNTRRPLRLFVAVENLFDAEYDVGRTPLRTVGAPRAVRVGLSAAWE